MAGALDHEMELHAAGTGDDALNVAEIRDRLAADRDDQIALLETGRRGGTVVHDHGDARDQNFAPLEIEQGGEDQDGEDEIGQRARHHHSCALPNVLGEKRNLALGLRHAGGGGLVRFARGVGVAVETHIAAERKGRQPPARAVAVDVMGDFRPKTHGKSVHLDSAQPADHEMAELMEKHHEAENEQEGR